MPPLRVNGPRVVGGWCSATLNDTPARSRVFSAPDQLWKRPECSSAGARIPYLTSKLGHRGLTGRWRVYIMAMSGPRTSGTRIDDGSLTSASHVFDFFDFFRKSQKRRPEARAQLRRDHRGRKYSRPAAESCFGRSRRRRHGVGLWTCPIGSLAPAASSRAVVWYIRDPHRTEAALYAPERKSGKCDSAPRSRSAISTTKHNP